MRAPNWLGDIMLCTPALTLLREAYPEAFISVLVKKELEEVLSGNPHISELITFSSGANLLGRIQFYLSLREKKIDLAILFTNSFESALSARLASAKQIVGYNRDFRGLFLTHPVQTPSRLPPRIHQSDYYLGLVKKKLSEPGVPQVLSSSAKEKGILVFTIPDSARQEATRVWEAEGLHTASLVVGFGPGAAFGTAKRWPPERYAMLGDKIVQRFAGRVVIFGSGADKEVSDKISAMMKERPVSLVGKSSIKSLGAFLEKCDVFVTNDSGPMHIAASVKTPVLAIFGPTDPSETSPLSLSGAVVSAEESCSPCWKRECPADHKCMEAVTPESVFEALEKILPMSD